MTNWLAYHSYKIFKIEFHADILEPVLLKHKDSIDSFGYMTKDMREFNFFTIHNEGLESVMIGDLARLYELTRIDMYAV